MRTNVLFKYSDENFSKIEDTNTENRRFTLKIKDPKSESNPTSDFTTMKEFSKINNFEQEKINNNSNMIDNDSANDYIVNLTENYIEDIPKENNHSKNNLDLEKFYENERNEYSTRNNDLNHDLNFAKNLSNEYKQLEISNLSIMTMNALRDLAAVYNVNLNNAVQRQQIISLILRKAVSIPEVMITYDGVLEVLDDNGNFGFLRSINNNYHPSNNDVYFPKHIIEKYNLKTGNPILCTIKSQNNSKKGEKYYPVDRILKINNRELSDSKIINFIKERVNFDDLIPHYPEERYRLENNKVSTQENITNRFIDLMCPIGKGQRALIVAPPRAGKTVLLKNIANSISYQYPHVKLFITLIGERPEEVTEMRESINAEVISSTFDEPAESHINVAEIILEKAKRLVESGEDVVIILDSITRLARAYNTVTPSSGKVLTGGVDSGALQRPKKWFGAARNIKGKGSLTIIGSALVETGSRMDEVIFEEFKGTGNCEVVLDRKMAEKRIFPAIDILKSGTRREELLMSPHELQRVWLLRKVLANLNPGEAAELLREKILATKTNEEFLHSLGTNVN